MNEAEHAPRTLSTSTWWRPPLAEVITSRVMGWALYSTVTAQYTMVHLYSHIVRFACGVLMPIALAATPVFAVLLVRLSVLYGNGKVPVLLDLGIVAVILAFVAIFLWEAGAI